MIAYTHLIAHHPSTDILAFGGIMPGSTESYAPERGTILGPLPEQHRPVAALVGAAPDTDLAELRRFLGDLLPQEHLGHAAYREAGEALHEARRLMIDAGHAYWLKLAAPKRNPCS